MGEALSLIRRGLRLSRQNQHVTGETVLRMVEARMHLEAGDYRCAHDLALETIPLARPGFPKFVTLIVLGEAQAGLREDRAAWESLDGVLRVSREEAFRMDWIFQLPLYRGMAELWLARGDLAAAQLHLDEAMNIMSDGKRHVGRVARVRDCRGSC
jgi:ATP/maltotriose-dependent transcriptional regulator MalT